MRGLRGLRGMASIGVGIIPDEDSIVNAIGVRACGLRAIGA